MARYCISYKTMELFFDIGGAETVPELVSLYECWVLGRVLLISQAKADFLMKWLIFIKYK